MKYDLQLSNPKEFYHEVHRPSHFLNFASLQEGEIYNADREDMYAWKWTLVFWHFVDSSAWIMESRSSTDLVIFLMRRLYYWCWKFLSKGSQPLRTLWCFRSFLQMLFCLFQQFPLSSFHCLRKASAWKCSILIFVASGALKHVHLCVVFSTHYWICFQKGKMLWPLSFRDEIVSESPFYIPVNSLLLCCTVHCVTL